MKNPLRYQITDFDCGTTSLINAITFLFEREEIPYGAVRFIGGTACDLCLADVDGSCGGTSEACMRFLASWLNEHAGRIGLPLVCEHLLGDAVTMRVGGPLDRALREGAVVVAGVCLGSDHYVLLTGQEPAAGDASAREGADGADGDLDLIRVFDPYYDTWPLHDTGGPVVGTAPVDDCPFSHNRLVERRVFDGPEGMPYSLAQKSAREATIFRRVG